MGVTIEQLNYKYKLDDPQWDFSLFPIWLEKKGIPNTPDHPVVSTTLEQTLIDFDLDTLPDSHDLFDNLVLLRALLNKQELNRNILKFLGDMTQESLNKTIKKYDADWYKLTKWQKIKMVLKGLD